MSMQVTRFDSNPIIETSEAIGDIVNYPSVIKVPSWIDDPLGEYYCYFSHKNGKYIRLAYANSITGPWKLYSPGTLRLEETPFVGHIASPNVHVDDDNELIRLYYHGETRIRDLVGTARRNTVYRQDHYNYRPRSLPHRILFETGRYLVNTLETKRAAKRSQQQGATESTSKSAQTDTSVLSSLVENAPYKRLLRGSRLIPPAVQETRQAVSTDGRSFTDNSPILGPSWFAVFGYDARYFAMGRDGYVYESSDPDTPFSRHRNLFSGHRHFGVHVSGDQLEVYYSRTAENPECILRTCIALAPTVDEWEIGETTTVICPETAYEGVDVDPELSTERNPWERRQELRDPHVFVDNGTKYLFYVVGGESGIAVAKLTG